MNKQCKSKQNRKHTEKREKSLHDWISSAVRNMIRNGAQMISNRVGKSPVSIQSGLENDQDH